MKFRVGVPRNRPLALPVVVDDWMPTDHLVRVVDRVVDALDLSAVEAKFHDQGPGAPAYAPKLLLKLLAYGYLTQRFSSRRISLACREDLAFLWLTRLEQPKHSVLSAFRQQHVDDLPEWLAQVVLLCIAEGMVGWKLGALDGTKIHWRPRPIGPGPSWSMHGKASPTITRGATRSGRPGFKPQKPRQPG